MTHTGGGVEEHLRRVRSLYTLVTSIDLVELENRDIATIRDEFVPAARNVLRAALGVFDRLARDFGEDGPAGPDRAPSRDTHAREIADLCFIARMELAPRAADLERQSQSDDKWALLASASHAFGCVIKAVFALEPRLAKLAGRPLEINRHRSTGDSVRVRRVYHNLHRQVMLDGTPTPETIDVRMQRIADALERLIVSPVYPRLRGSDRCQIRRLKERLDGWLAEEDERCPAVGLALWRDLSALSAMFLEIRRRQELVDYDLRTLSGLRPVVEERPSQAIPDAPIVATLANVVGRDREIDELVEDPSRWTCGRLLGVLDRVIADLEVSLETTTGVAIG